MTTRVAFIGLGNIGRPMARRIAAAALELSVYDIDSGACEELARAGARVARSAAEAARDAEVIGICVRDDADVRAVTVGPDGVVEGARPGSIIAIHSTILPSTVLEMAAAAEARGIGVVDAPVTGGAAGARRGTLTYMVGGAQERVERCRPVFESSAAAIVPMGPVGSGAAMKLCLSIMTYLGLLAAFEATRLAEGAGLPAERFEEVTRAAGVLTDPSLPYIRMLRALDEGRPDPGLQDLLRGFAALAEKDLSQALALARTFDLELPAAELGRSLMPEVYCVADRAKAGRNA